MFEAKTGPGFVFGGVFDRVGNRHELRGHDAATAAGDVFVGDI